MRSQPSDQKPALTQTVLVSVSATVREPSTTALLGSAGSMVSVQKPGVHILPLAAESGSTAPDATSSTLVQPAGTAPLWPLACAGQGWRKLIRRRPASASIRPAPPSALLSRDRRSKRHWAACAGMSEAHAVISATRSCGTSARFDTMVMSAAAAAPPCPGRVGEKNLEASLPHAASSAVKLGKTRPPGAKAASPGQGCPARLNSAWLYGSTTASGRG
mmetsp:Transcript_1436/g.5653  ORF Transcript_1436/g.5653 Transcript_1436/m.5653 type:complete len:218 (-) Transcript_1436:1370-2023(-)